jgi:Fe-S cluster biogenesis protein NfuA
VEIYDDDDLLDTVYVNQRKDGGQWNYLGTYDFSGQARLVVVSDGGGCSTCADAVEFIPNGDTPIDDPDETDENTILSKVIDESDAEATSSGIWKTSYGKDPYGARSLYSFAADATYAYESTLSGRYDVEMWWTTHNTRCTSAPVEIYDDDDLLDTVYVNQQKDGGQWNYLGTYDFSGQARLVVVSEDSACSTCADAVQYLYNGE